MKRKVLILTIIALFAVISVYAYTKRPRNGVSVVTKTHTLEMYYVPVSEYFSQRENITAAELIVLSENGNLLVEKGEKDNLGKILGPLANGASEINVSDLKPQLTKGKTALLRWSSVTPDLKSLSYEGKYLWKKSDAEGYSLKTTIETRDDTKAERFDPKNLTTLTSTGDVILGRTVAKKMSELGYFHPWEKIYERLALADLTFLDLEVPISDLVKPPLEGMSFVTPKAAMVGLVKSGVDLVAIANNHSTNFGTKVFSDSIYNLKEVGIPYVGGGENLAEAEKTVILEKNGLKWAFLNWNAIVGAIPATESSPGVAEVALKPWSKDDSEADAKKVEAKIKEAKGKADVVVVEFHWGVEYVTKQIPSQENLAKRAVDAGADLVVGTHPHAVQGSEYYKGKYITYSLGNFIFDQEWSQGTKEGTMMESYFYGTKNVASNLVPILIEDYNQPRFLSGAEGRSIIERIKTVSNGL